MTVNYYTETKGLNWMYGYSGFPEPWKTVLEMWTEMIKSQRLTLYIPENLSYALFYITITAWGLMMDWILDQALEP